MLLPSSLGTIPFFYPKTFGGTLLTKRSSILKLKINLVHGDMARVKFDRFNLNFFKIRLASTVLLKMSKAASSPGYIH
jgi:hypothetical protein